MMTESIRRTAIVTGASRGIGRAIALALAADGLNIVINYHQNALLAEELANELDSALPYQADVGDEEQVKKMVKDAASHFGSVDVLVNCAGINSDALSARMTAEAWEKVIHINLSGAFYCCQAVQRYMLKRKWGRIVNIGSVVGQSGNAGQINYAASKAGLIGLTKTLARELGTAGITANLVAPGIIKTDMWQNVSAEKMAAYNEHIPLSRWGQPQDVANLVSFLCSDRAGYITGQIIGVDGGLYL